VSANASPRMLYVNLGCGAILAVGWSAGLAWLLGKMCSLFGAHWITIGKTTGGVLGGLLFLHFVRIMWKSLQEERGRFKRDIEKGEVEVFDIQTGRVSELHGDHSSIDPAICIDLGDNRVLLLIGQWIWDADRYVNSEGKTPDPINEDHDGHFNRLPAPWSFPSARFVLRRLPESGHVLSISPEGSYIKQENSKIVLVAKHGRDYRESQILQGSMDNLSAAIEAIPRVQSQQSVGGITLK